MPLLATLAIAPSLLAPSVLAGHHVLARTRVGVTPADLSALCAADGPLDRAGVAGATPLFRAPPALPRGADRLRRWVRLELRGEVEAADAVAALATARELFERVELDGLAEPGGATAFPNDPEFSKQYGLHSTGQMVNGNSGVVDADCDAPEAWAMSTGGPVVLAIIDAGVHPHPDLADRLLPGWNVIAQNDDTSSECSSHGTHVAGIAAAGRDNGLGIAGLAGDALILPVKVFDNVCSSQWSIIAEGLVWATDHGARVANLSIHGYEYNEGLEDAVDYAHANGVLVVAIAGNNASQVAYPGKCAKAMAIASTTNKDLKSSFSNPGPEVDVAAAGSNVHSLVDPDQYGSKSGTSMAAPLVSGLAALLLGTNPWMTPDTLWSVIVESVDDVESAGFDELTGWGRINAATALQIVAARMASGDVDADGDVDGGDLGLVLGAWGQPGASDVDGDGATGGSDLGILLSNWTG